jgi:hypothetical protein
LKQHKLILGFACIISLICFSCKKTQEKSNTCNCYEYHEKFGALNTISVGWSFDYQTTPTPELCEKDNGEWIYYGSQSQFRYQWKCN